MSGLHYYKDEEVFFFERSFSPKSLSIMMENNDFIMKIVVFSEDTARLSFNRLHVLRMLLLKIFETN